MQAREQFKLDFQHYQAQLTPAQVQQQALEKRQRMAKRKANRKKRVREIAVDRGQGKARSFNIDFHFSAPRNTS